MPDKLYWDSNAFLAWLQNERGREAACRDTLTAAQSGEYIIVSSALTIAEVLWIRGAPKLSEDKADVLNRWFRRSFFRVVNLDRRIAQRAQRLVWENGIKPKDAVHVATAFQYGCPILETFDGQLIAKAADLEGVHVREPQPAKQGSLNV
ncbi:MAG: type II toxin-antitoxin system VapC family toxin [Pseudomonadota bacterium]